MLNFSYRKGRVLDKPTNYLGRMVAIGQTSAGVTAVMYRVSSRSYPNRRIIERSIPRALSVVPRKGFEEDALGNPYVTYNAVRTVGIHRGRIAVAGNGSHVDFIAEKLEAGIPLQEAIGSVLLTLGYEKDGDKTPRIVGTVTFGETCGWLGFISENKFFVERVPLIPERCLYIATGRDNIGRGIFRPKTSREIAKHLIESGDFKRFEHPIVSAAAINDGSGFELRFYNVPTKTGS